MARTKSRSLEDMKKDAVAAGLSLLQRDGLQGVSARKIAGEMGYAVGTLYNVFEDFEDILLHMKAAILQEMRNFIFQSDSSKKQPTQRILDFASRYSAYAKKYPHQWNLLHNSPITRELPQWYRHEVDEIFSHVEILLQNLQNHKAKEIEIAGKVLWAGLHGICSLSLSQKLEKLSAAKTDELIESFVKNYLEGFKNAFSEK